MSKAIFTQTMITITLTILTKDNFLLGLLLFLEKISFHKLKQIKFGSTKDINFNQLSILSRVWEERGSQSRKDGGLAHTSSGNFYFFPIDSAPPLKGLWPTTKEPELGTQLITLSRECMDVRPVQPTPTLKTQDTFAQEYPQLHSKMFPSINW